MDNLEQTAKAHILKAEQTIDYLRRNRLGDPGLQDHKKDFIRRDIEAMEFLIKYAKEALALRGVKI